MQCPKSQLRPRSSQPSGAYAEALWEGFTKSSWGSGGGGGGGRREPPSGVQGGAPEDFKINAFQRLRTPVSSTFESHCYFKKSMLFPSYKVIRTTSS